MGGGRIVEYHFSNDVDYYAQYGLGMAYANLHQYEASIAALQAAHSLQPSETDAAALLNNILAQMQQAKVGAEKK